MRWQVITVLVVMGIPLAARAQPLADRVPADAILYLGWQGSQGVGAGYEKSHLKAVLDASNLPQVFNDTIPRVIQRVAREDAQAGQMLQLVASLGAPFWRHPVAFYFAGVDFQGQAGPRPKAAILCNAGADAEGLLKQLDAVAIHMAGAPFPVRTFRQGDLVVISLGYEAENAAVVQAPDVAKSLAAAAPFKQTLAHVHKEPVVIAYVDVESVVRQVGRAVQLNAGDEAVANVAKVVGALGIDGLKRIVWTGAFDGPDWSTQAFVAAPTPRTGLLTLIESKPVSDDILKAIPKSATWMTIGRFDLGKFGAELRNAAGKIDPQVLQGFDMAMGVAQMALVMNIQKDLFEPLGDQWALYCDPTSAGRGFVGLTLVNRLNKPDDAQRALGKLELFIDNTVNGFLARRKMRLSFEQTKVGDLNIHYVALPVVSPSWTIKDGYLYAALFPQTLVPAAAQPGAGSSILDCPEFVALRKRLGAENASGMSYADLPRSIEQGYQLWLMGSQLATGMADIFGVKTPPMVVPPLAKLKTHMTPAAAFSWTDDAGWHSKSLSPFPGSELLGSPGGIITAAAPALATGVLGARTQARTMRLAQ